MKSKKLKNKDSLNYIRVTFDGLSKSVPNNSSSSINNNYNNSNLPIFDSELDFPTLNTMGSPLEIDLESSDFESPI
ncbi:hypothetical protein, partial [Chromobacterium amazonense]|uniref:hypothetical protein n=1 Tax=Chromobacterium amazonense TaxID=1382803 RepID=UPI0031F719DA